MHDYPYLPEGRSFLFVPIANSFMCQAKDLARRFRGELHQPNGVVIVQDGVVVGEGSIGMNYHAEHGCYRIQHNCPTGVGYDLCPGCSPLNHGEPNAINDARAKGFDPEGADLYLWGHWWCCKPCWDAMIEAGIRDVYLLDQSRELFDRNSSTNIIGQDF